MASADILRRTCGAGTLATWTKKWEFTATRSSTFSERSQDISSDTVQILAIVGGDNEEEEEYEEEEDDS